MADLSTQGIADADPQGYRLLQEMIPRLTFLCCDASDNVLILKRLEDDCLHRNQLHPSIRDRLARVRELAHPRIATLRTVERWQGNVFLIWIYLDGETWEDALKGDSAIRLHCMVALAACVSGLHETGIVHGSIHGRNVIVRQGGQIWLTHLSPYLYTDPLADIHAVVDLLREAGESFATPAKARLAELLTETEFGQLTLRGLSNAMVSIENPPAEIPSQAAPERAVYRRSSLLLALLVVAIGLVTWFTIHALTTKPATLPTLQTAFHSRHSQ